METTRETNARRQREFRARIRARIAADPALKLCPHCGGPHPGGASRSCPACRERARTAARRKSAAGLCPDCGRPKTDGTKLCCAACRAKRTQTTARVKAANKAAGLCACSRSLDPGCASVRCAYCRAYHKQRKQNQNSRQLKA